MNTQDKFTEKNFGIVYHKSLNLPFYLECFTPKNDIQVYKSFVTTARDFFGLKREEEINIWHIEQNLFKSYQNGKQSIKNLCKTYFYNLQGEIDYLKKREFCCGGIHETISHS
jgi:dihydroorotase